MNTSGHKHHRKTRGSPVAFQTKCCSVRSRHGSAEGSEGMTVPDYICPCCRYLRLTNHRRRPDPAVGCHGNPGAVGFQPGWCHSCAPPVTNEINLRSRRLSWEADVLQAAPPGKVFDVLPHAANRTVHATPRKRVKNCGNARGCFLVEFKAIVKNWLLLLPICPRRKLI